jgi:hypothetical protein
MTTTHPVGISPATAQTTARWRAALSLNALVAGAALAIKISESATATDPRLPDVGSRVVNELCYFTIQSNFIVVAVCALLAWQPDRWRWVAGAPRLVGLACITVTGVVYYALLASDEHFVGLAQIADIAAHAVSPILFVLTWMFLGPRGHLRARHIAALGLFITLWVTLTLVRGAITHIYPYDFVDVQTNGYVSVIATIVVLTSAAMALALAAVRFDRDVAR